MDDDIKNNNVVEIRLAMKLHAIYPEVKGGECGSITRWNANARQLLNVVSENSPVTAAVSHLLSWYRLYSVKTRKPLRRQFVTPCERLTAATFAREIICSVSDAG